MSSHGCIRCSKCGGACPLCGTCACHGSRHYSIFDSLNLAFAKEVDEEILGPPIETMLFHGFAEGDLIDVGQGNDDGV